jgi:drug/metabolite transporter (DMT)-like permease
MAALLALASSLLWGSGDFLGGRATRGWGVLRVLAWSQTVTLVLVWCAVVVGASSMGLPIPLHAVLVGALGGAAGVIALAAFYRALAVGPMSLVPPIAAAGVVLPVSVGLAGGGRPSTIVLAGIVLAVIGVVLASAGSSPDDGTSGGRVRIAPSTLGLCVVAASGFACIFVALDAAAGDSPATALVATAGVRLGSCATIVGALVVTRTRPWRGVDAPSALGFAAIGILDTSANLLFAVAAALGRLEVVAILGSLYPAVTSALAHVVLGERLGRLQLAGVVSALAGVMLLAAR